MTPDAELPACTKTSEDACTDGQPCVTCPHRQTALRGLLRLFDSDRREILDAVTGVAS